MNDIDAWVQWWALPWRYAHPHWHILDASPALLRNQHAGASKSLGIAPCLPCAPTTSLMQLALAQPAHYDALLQRVERICRTTPSAARDDTQRLWCQRLARALHTQDWLEPADDPLQLLRAWLEPPVWQRLRLRFAPARIETLEQKPVPAISPAKLRTLWQTVLWHTRPRDEGHNHADTPHD